VVPTASAYSAVVYAARSTDVRHVVVDGRVVVKGGDLLTIDAPRAVADARRRAGAIFGRM
jgi:5-methylthioadenosine/S-adenosylhomocysteine deaminase